MLKVEDLLKLSSETGVSLGEINEIIYPAGDIKEFNPFLSKGIVSMEEFSGSGSRSREIISVPAGVKYLSEWPDFSLRPGHYILDKKLPGCGFTEYVLSCPSPVILCSPRRILLQNKKDKHGDSIYYFRNDLEQDLQQGKDVISINNTSSEILNSGIKVIKETVLRIKSLKNNLRDYVSSSECPKIIVTYDSFRHVKSVLSEMGVLGNFFVVVDEFQSIFTDSRFKGGTEYNFVSTLSESKNVCYASATPMMDEYLQLLPEFRDLPYLELDWSKEEPGRVGKPCLEISVVGSIVPKALKVIESYKKGDFELGKIPGTEKWIPSKEAVLYVNSVSTIISIIKKSGLGPEEVNILCADTSGNRKELKRGLGDNWKIGRVPLMSEPHKMITICTRTVYLGADFMSTCARTFIFSDANIDSLAVDISLDLPQILGRQRLDCNPFKNRANFYYKPLGKSMESKEEFDKVIERKIRDTNTVINWYTKGKEMTESSVDVFRDILGKAMNIDKYEKYYLSFDKDNNNCPVFNSLVMISEKRAFDIQKLDYADRFTVYDRIGKSSYIVTAKMTRYIHEVLRDTKLTRRKRLKMLCINPYFTDSEKSYMAKQSGDWMNRYYNEVGPSRCRALSYNPSRIDNEILNIMVSQKQELLDDIMESIVPGQCYTKKEVKDLLKFLYQKYGLQDKPKSTDLRKYFEINESTKIKEPETGKWVAGIKIIRKL